MHNIACPESEPGKQKKNGPVALAYCSGSIAGINQALHILFRQISWERGQSPTGNGGNGSQEVHSAEVLGGQKSYKHPKRRRAVFYRRPTETAALVNNELP